MPGPKLANAVPSAFVRRGGSQLAILAIVMLVLLTVVFFAPSYWQYIATIGAAQAIIGLSIGVVFGIAGMLSLAQLSLAAIGAWTVAYLAADVAAVPVPWAIVIGGILAVPIGLLVALPALRLRGVNLAVVTLGFVILIYSLANTEAVPGSQSTLYVSRPEWLRDDFPFFAVAWGFFLLLAVASILLRRSRWGLSWIAISRSERAAASLGVSIVRSKLSAFGVSAFFAGIGGGILVTVNGSSDAGSFSPIQALLFFVLAVMFGAGYWEGALALGVLNTVISAVFRDLGVPPDFASLLFGIGAIQILGTGSKAGFSGDIRLLIGKIRRKRSAASGSTIAPVLISAPRAIADKAVIREGNALDVVGLTVKYGAVVALDDVNLAVPFGRVVGLVGPNGAGKSTLIDAVTGYTKPTSGSITAAGTDLAGMPVFKRSRIVRRTFQTERTMESLSARDFLRLAAPKAKAVDVDEMLEFTGITTPEVALRHLDVRSRRLLMMGGTLIARPDIVLLDEPAAGLDADESTDLASRIREIPERFGCGVLLIEHDMELVRTVCTEVTVLDFGKVIAAGATAAVLDDPAVATAYLGDEVASHD